MTNYRYSTDEFIKLYIKLQYAFIAYCVLMVS